MKKTAIIIDGSPMARVNAHVALEKLDYEIVGEFSTGTQGMEAALDYVPDLLITEVLLPDMLLSEIITFLTENKLDIELIIHSSIDGGEQIVKLEWGSVKKLAKCVDADELYLQLKALGV